MSDTGTHPTGQPKIAHTYLRGRTYWGRTKVDGEIIRESLRTDDPVEAQKRVSAWLAEVSPRHVRTGELSFEDVASSWIEAYKREHTEKTWRRYSQSMKQLAPTFGHLAWADVTRAKLVEYMTLRRSRDGVTAATINRDRVVISNLFEHAIDQGWADDNPVRRLSKKARKERRQPLTLPLDEMVEAIFQHMHSSFGELCRLALLTGMRRDELADLTWMNVVLDRRVIQLFRTKSHKVRVIDLCDAAVELLRKRNDRTGLVFKTNLGKRYGRVSEMWRDVVGRAEERWNRPVEVPQGVPQPVSQAFVRIRFHDLRHLFAIRYLRNGGNLYRLQQLMGHSTIRQTEAYLDYLTPEQQLAAKGVAQ